MLYSWTTARAITLATVLMRQPEMDVVGEQRGGKRQQRHQHQQRHSDGEQAVAQRRQMLQALAR
jgi:hypothetical protein